MHFVMLLMVICGMTVFNSCSPTELEGTFNGEACAKPDSAKVGETVVLSVENISINVEGDNLSASIDISNNLVITKGKCHEIANYYIDGKKVAESTESKNKYSTEYTIKENLGEHELSVVFTSNADKEDITNNVKSSKFRVIE